MGSENGYTIGLEHEGYVSDPTWYTTAMYESSADLVKDIVNSGYGMNPLSCYKGSAQTVLNACYQIKGHIHYPNQTHTDPGINWNWPYYYSLINDSIETTRLYTCNGTFTDAGGAGNYPDLTTYLTIIEPIGADSITMSFSNFVTEAGYDSLYIFDGDNPGAPLIGAYTGTQNPGTVVARSGKMALLFTSDCIINGAGWQATWQCGNCTPFYVEVDSLKDATCTAGGHTEVSAWGVTGGVTYNWNDGATGAVRNNLPPGSYTVTATLPNNCNSERTVVIGNSDTLDYELLAEDIACAGDANGVAGVVVTNGSFPVVYSWSNGFTGAVQTGLAPGAYQYHLTDAHGCADSGWVTIAEPDAITALTDFSQNPQVQAVSGGTAPYTVISWDDCDSSLTGVIRCRYELTDARGCQWDTVLLRQNITGIQEPFVGTLNVYPNPAKEEIYINLPATHATKGYLNVIHITGTYVYQGEINVATPETFTCPIRIYPSGMYFIFYQVGEEVYTGKFIKQ